MPRTWTAQRARALQRKGSMVGGVVWWQPGGLWACRGLSPPSGKCTEMAALVSFYQDPVGNVWGSGLPSPTLRACLNTYRHTTAVLGHWASHGSRLSLSFLLYLSELWWAVATTCAELGLPEAETEPNASSPLIAWPPRVAHRVQSWIRVFVRYLVCDIRVRGSPVQLPCSQRLSP